MSETDIAQLTRTQLDTTVPDYSVSTERIESAESDEFYYYNSKFTKYLGYYKNIPELKKAVDALAIWAVGKGYEADTRTQTIMDNLIGHGKDTDDSILFNLFINKKINGDAFAQIIREKGELRNLKVLNPEKVRVVFDKNGIIKRYDYWQGSEKWKRIETEDILHLINDKVADEVHGTSIIQACQWVIDARNEAMEDWRRTLHRSTIRILEVDADDTTRLRTLRSEYAQAIKKGEVLIVPKGNVGFPDAKVNYIDPQAWIQYLENFFYQAVGVPRVIATSENFTEASSKVGYLSFEPIYTREQKAFEAELWNQLGIKIEFHKPASLAGNLQKNQEKNTQQTTFQPNDVNMSGVMMNEQPTA